MIARGSNISWFQFGIAIVRPTERHSHHPPAPILLTSGCPQPTAHDTYESGHSAQAGERGTASIADQAAWDRIILRVDPGLCKTRAISWLSVGKQRQSLQKRRRSRGKTLSVSRSPTSAGSIIR